MSLSSEDGFSDYDEMTLYEDLDLCNGNGFPSKIPPKPNKDNFEKDCHGKTINTQVTSWTISESVFGTGRNQVRRKTRRRVRCSKKSRQKETLLANNTEEFCDNGMDLKEAFSSYKETSNNFSSSRTNIFDNLEKALRTETFPNIVTPKQINFKITNKTCDLKNFQENCEITEACSHDKQFRQIPSNLDISCIHTEQSDDNSLLYESYSIFKKNNNNEQTKSNEHDANKAKYAKADYILSENKEDERSVTVNGTEITTKVKTDIQVNTETRIDGNCPQENERFDFASQSKLEPFQSIQKTGKPLSRPRKKKYPRKKKDEHISYTCDHCFKQFKTKEGMKNHYATHTGSTTYNCNECGKLFTSKAALKYHKASKHFADLNNTCKVCNKLFNHPRALKIHIMRTHNNNHLRYKCDTCGRDFAVLHNLKMHIMYGHHDLFGDSPVNETECTTCGKILSSVVTLKLHKQIHEGNQGHVCDLCGALFSRKTDKDRHRMTHTGEKPYKCDQCDYACIRPGDFNRHRLRHNDQSGGQKRYTCPFCDKTLVRKNEMAGHIGKHIDSMTSDDKESHIACTLCNLVLQSRCELIFHVKRFHDKQGLMKMKVFECQICNTCQGSKFMLEKHMLKEHHQLGLSYSCDICGLKVISISSLSRHKKRAHSPDEFPCPVCGKLFKHKSNLKDHVRFVHEKIKKYECSSCGLKFSECRYLRKHEQKHQLNIE